MDKRKLIQIIEKELEELKVITGEIADNENDSGLILEIALGKARVLCNEIELLRTLSAEKQASSETDIEEEIIITEESEVNMAEPELEIASPEDKIDSIPFSSDEFDETDALVDETDENLDLQDDLTDEDDDFADDDDWNEEEDDDESQDEELIEFEQDSNQATEIKIAPEPPVKKTELKTDMKPGFKEITLDEPDEEPIVLQTQSAPKTTERPVFREIPKPEEPVAPQMESNETSHKNSTFNDSIGETKNKETKLNSGPISSLKAAIGLNDRYQFVREIFGNNTEKYNKVIDHLDKLETIQQAVEYLKSQLTLQKTETSMKFVDLLKRRFTK